MAAPRFSVVVPVRDGEATLEPALDSILRQRFDDFEVVVVDDGSTDSTPDLLSAIDDPRVRSVRQEPAGAAAARNRGVAEARGEWITFLDADDEALPDWLDTLAGAAVEGVGVVCAGVELVSPDGEASHPPERLPVDGGGLYSHRAVLFLAGAFATRRELLDGIGGYDEALAYSENTDLGIRLVAHCLARGLEVRSVPRALVRYYLRPPGARAGGDLSGVRLRAIRVLLERHEEAFARDPRSREIYCTLGGVLAARGGHPAEARRFFQRAVRAAPWQPKNHLRLAASLVPGLASRLWAEERSEPPVPILKRLRESARHRGFDVVRYPHPGSLGAHLRILFDRLGIDCVLDVGAHRGEYVGFLRELGYRGSIHSFEPVPASFDGLVRRFAGDPEWTGHAIALGDREGELEIQVMRGATFSSAHRPTAYARERFGDATRVEERLRVPVRRLDGVLDDLAASDGSPGSPKLFLKIDTQGSELEVLAGAGERLARVAALQAELPLKPVYEGVPPLWEALPRLRALGFEVSGIFPVSIDRGDLSLIEVDCVAVRTGAGTEEG